MNIEVFTGVGPELKLLETVEIHCVKCGCRLRLPVDMIIQRVADSIEDYYRKQNEYLAAENKKLREIIQFGHQVQLIKEVAGRL